MPDIFEELASQLNISTQDLWSLGRELAKYPMM